MRIVVYTCVIGGYDRVFPPVRREPDVDYVLFSDDPNRQVAGWRTVPINRSRFASDQAANRYYKMLGQRALPGYDVAIYIDGNFRVLGRCRDMAQTLLTQDVALMLYPHPLRQTVADEIKACVATGKLAEAKTAGAELAGYQADGFQDDQGLFEAGILVKAPTNPMLDAAMALWWEQFERFGTRDQISLPYVVWKTGVPVQRHDHSFRDPNPYFGLYPHRGATGVRPAYADMVARAYGSRLHRGLLRAWDGVRSLRRRLKSGRSA